MYGYIYLTRNTITGKIYIGQHHSNIFVGNKYLGSGKLIRQAIEKYGKDVFTVELLEEVEEKEDMDSREIYWIDFYNSTDRNIGYNISAGGNSNRTMIGENNPFFGKQHSLKTKEKLKEAHKRRTNYHKFTEEEKLQLSKKLKGRKCTWKHKISENAKNNSNYGMKNKQLSNEAKKIISEKAKIRWKDDNFRQKQKEKTKEKWQDESYRQSHINGMLGKSKKITYKECPICHKQISASNYNRHIAHCIYKTD